MALDGRWGDTSIALPKGDWYSALDNSRHSGGVKRLNDLLEGFPVQVLVRK
jgi:maltooligosyltrehalose synthase